MYHQEFEPPEELRDSIKCFWYNRGEFGEQGANFEVMPDGYAEIIFHFGGGCRISTDEGWQALPSPFLMGLLNRPALINANGRLEIIGIRCFPWTVFDLLGLSSGKDAVHFLEHSISRFQFPLSDCIEKGNIDEALAQLTQGFLDVRSQVSTDSTLFNAGVAMSKAKGTLPVSRVASAAHATVRTLERKFKRSSGYSVKDVSGLMRFEQARNQLWLYPSSNLAALAQELGYTDQSHLSREFKRYSGTTPAAFARKAKRERAAVPHFGAFVQD